MTVTLDDLMGLLISTFLVSIFSAILNFIYFDMLNSGQARIVKKINSIRKRQK